MGGSEALNRNFSSWGRAGGWDYGSICGVLVGTTNVIDMVAVGNRNDANRPLLHELFEWYQNRALPDYEGLADFYAYLEANSANWPGPLPNSPAPRSTLCHDSVSQWCLYTGYAENSPTRSNRCGLLTAEATYITAKLLCYNAHFGGAPNWFRPDASTVGETCKTAGCHDWNVRPFVKSDCNQCHK